MPSDSVYREKRVPGALSNTWTAFHNDILSMIGLHGILLLALLCLFGDWLAPYALDQQFMGYQLLPPSWSHYGEVSFFLGTDDLGRDIMSRLLSGAGPTVGSAFLATLAAAVIGILWGIWAGLTHGLRSAILNHILDVLLALPSLLLAIIITAFLGPRLEHAILAVALSLLPRIIREISSAVREEMEKEYIIAARLDGASTHNIFFNAILPNIVDTMVSEFTRSFSIAILDIVALGFLDLGAQLPSSEWGAMLGDSLEILYVAPWTVMLPGAAILISVLIVNIFGDGVHRAIIAGTE